MKIYNFFEQFKKGQESEEFLDKWLANKGYKIKKASRDEERSGIDRWVTSERGTWSVEYKTDFLAHNTGNVYLETVSVGRYNENGVFVVEKEGWLHTTQSDYLFYFIPGAGTLYMFKPKALRQFADDNSLRSVQVKNPDYQGRGLLAPIQKIGKFSVKSWQL